MRSYRLSCHRPTETSSPMHTHTNTRLKQRCRLRLVSQYLIENWPLKEVATEAGISLLCSYKWLARYDQAWQPHSWIDGVFAADTGGTSIHRYCSRPWIYGTTASTSGTSPDCLPLPSAPWPGCSISLVPGR